MGGKIVSKLGPQENFHSRNFQKVSKSNSTQVSILMSRNSINIKKVWFPGFLNVNNAMRTSITAQREAEMIKYGDKKVFTDVPVRSSSSYVYVFL